MQLPAPRPQFYRQEVATVQLVAIRRDGVDLILGIAASDDFVSSNPPS
jgi:hypothetical protein